MNEVICKESGKFRPPVQDASDVPETDAVSGASHVRSVQVTPLRSVP